MSEVILTEEEVINMLKMLSSQDSENWSVAFTAIENMNFTHNLGAILILYKYGYPSHELWSQHAPITWHVLARGFNTVDRGIIRTFPPRKLVVEILKFYSINKEQVELFKRLDDLLFPGDRQAINKITNDFLEEAIRNISIKKTIIESYENSTTEERGTSES